MMLPTLATNIATLEQTPALLRALTATLPDAALDAHPTTEDWSIREIVAHLVDDEISVMRLRLERIVKEDHPLLTPYDEKAWYAQRNTTRDQLEQLLGDFELQRAASLNVVQLLRPSDWAREGNQPEYGTFTAAHWIEHWVEHDQAHLRQIEQSLAAFAPKLA